MLSYNYCCFIDSRSTSDVGSSAVAWLAAHRDTLFSARVFVTPNHACSIQKAIAQFVQSCPSSSCVNGETSPPVAPLIIIVDAIEGNADVLVVAWCITELSEAVNDDDDDDDS